MERILEEEGFERFGVLDDMFQNLPYFGIDRIDINRCGTCGCGIEGPAPDPDGVVEEDHEDVIKAAGIRVTVHTVREEEDDDADDTSDGDS